MVDAYIKKYKEFMRKHDALVKKLFEGKITDKQFYYKEKALEKKYGFKF